MFVIIFSIETYLSTDSWAHTDFYVWTLHLWVLLRRLRYEGSDGDIMGKMIIDRFMHTVDDRIVQAGIHQYQISKFTKNYQEAFYGFMVNMDRYKNILHSFIF